MDRQRILQAANWLQELSVLTAAHRQALTQLTHCAGEHTAQWQTMVGVIANRIEMKEKQIAQALSTPGFRAKREV